MGVADQRGHNGEEAWLVLLCCQSMTGTCLASPAVLLLLLLVEESWRDLGCSVPLLSWGLLSVNMGKCGISQCQLCREGWNRETPSACPAEPRSWCVWVSPGGEGR